MNNLSKYKYVEYPKVKYHPKHEPKTVQDAEEEKQLGRGWYETPNDFPKPLPIWGMLRARKTWWEEWKWLVLAIGTILGIIVAMLTIVKDLG